MDPVRQECGVGALPSLRGGRPIRSLTTRSVSASHTYIESSRASLPPGSGGAQRPAAGYRGHETHDRSGGCRVHHRFERAGRATGTANGTGTHGPGPRHDGWRWAGLEPGGVPAGSDWGASAHRRAGHPTRGHRSARCRASASDASEPRLDPPGARTGHATRLGRAGPDASAVGADAPGARATAGTVAGRPTRRDCRADARPTGGGVGTDQRCRAVVQPGSSRITRHGKEQRKATARARAKTASLRQPTAPGSERREVPNGARTKRRHVPNGAKSRTARSPEQREVPNSAKSRTARSPRRRENGDGGTADPKTAT